jgi:hypothetical protein
MGALKRSLGWLPQNWGLGGGSARCVSLISGFSIRLMTVPHSILPLDELVNRHPGLTPAIAASYLEAAAVCLNRHHQPPSDFELQDNETSSIVTLIWEPPSLQTQLAWANTSDTTEAGAYACGLAAIARSRNLYTIERAEMLTGADYYMAPLGDDGTDLENYYRIEISGSDLAKLDVRRRLRVKLKQLRQGRSNLPAIAVVVGFKASLILIQTLEDEDELERTS